RSAPRGRASSRPVRRARPPRGRRARRSAAAAPRPPATPARGAPCRPALHRRRRPGRARGHDRVGPQTGEKRRADGEPGVSPGRSRRCKGRRSEPKATGREAGKAARRAPRVRRPTARRALEPLAEGGFVLSRIIVALAVAGAVLALAAPALATAVHV